MHKTIVFHENVDLTITFARTLACKFYYKDQLNMFNNHVCSECSTTQVLNPHEIINFTDPDSQNAHGC